MSLMKYLDILSYMINVRIELNKYQCLKLNNFLSKAKLMSKLYIFIIIEVEDIIFQNLNNFIQNII